MLRVYVYTHSRFKNKAVLETQGKTLEHHSGIYQKLEDMLVDEKDNSYICNDELVFDRLKDLWLCSDVNRANFNNLKLYVNSRNIFGSKYGKNRAGKIGYDLSKSFTEALTKIINEIERINNV